MSTMKNLEQREQYVEEARHRKHRRQRLIAGLGVVVVLVTAIALMVPAISMTWNTAPQGTLVAGTTTLSGYPAQSFQEDIAAGSGSAAVSVQVEAPEGALPEGATMKVTPIVDEAVIDAAKEEAVDKTDMTADAVRAVAVDIAFFDRDGKEIEPLRDVSVTMNAHAVGVQDQLAVVHVDDEKNADVVPVTMVDAEDEQVQFTANQFSVYAIVYTVDFHFDLDGNVYDFSITGGEAIGIGELAEALHIVGDEDEAQFESAEEFVSYIEDVEFSDPSLVWVGGIEEDTMVYDLMRENKLSPIYRLGTTDVEFTALVTKVLDGPGWALMALCPFNTDEALVITMVDGETITVRVTDEQNATMTTDSNGNQVVDTIANPAGTTIDLFDYWIVDNYHDTDVDPDRWIYKNTQGRAAWPGHNNANDPFSHEFLGYYFDGALPETQQFWVLNESTGNYEMNPLYLKGNGNNMGINKGHQFKFTDSSGRTVLNGTLRTPNDDNHQLVNSWTGNADPTQGLVSGTLVDGYPKLSGDSNLGVDNESLAYLFDDTSHNGKQKYGGVDHLLYVDPDGYYTYDSRDYAADYDENSNSFVLTEQTSDSAEVRGFWPFGDRVYWCGVHMNTQFSMPINGKVVNPKNEEKDMQFEFSGDDDTWLYVDGVLVGDGGGIHNRTEIDINFATGKAMVTGKKDPGHMGSFEETKWLDDIFIAAGNRPDGTPYYNEADWEDIPGDEGVDEGGVRHKRFKAGTYHTFDMFYLERGGGESNLYIHYNLVSTTDFTGHKAYDGFPDDDMMQRDQFQFEMIGLDGRYESVPDEENGGYKLVEAGWQQDSYSIPQDNQAIMPSAGTEAGEGTVADPKKIRGDVEVEGQQVQCTIYTTGVTEDGNINFGDALISEAEKAAKEAGHASVYRYIIREIVPVDAVNDVGLRWGDATEDQKKNAGPFVKDQVAYDGKIYYMSARVTSWDQSGSDGNTYTKYGLSKTYYTDDTFTTVESEASFVDFRNTYKPEYGGVEFTKVDGLNHPLPGAEFTLYSDRACTNVLKDKNGNELKATSGADGKVSFTDVPGPREYYMKETVTPQGYVANDTVYMVRIESHWDTTHQSKVYMMGDDSQTALNEIANYKHGEISVIKEWQDANGNAVPGGSKTARVKLLRQKSTTANEGVAHTVRFTISIAGRSDLVYTSTQSVVGDVVTIDWWDTNQDIATFTVSNNLPYTMSGYWDDVNHKNRKVVIQGVSSDVDVAVTYPSDKDWLFYSDHTPWMQNVSMVGSDSIKVIEDAEFNASQDASHYADLDESNDWAHKWTIGDGGSFDFPASNEVGSYYYYLAEVKPDGSLVAIGDTVMDDVTLKEIVYNPSLATGEPGLLQGTITAVNEVESQPLDIVVKKTDGADSPRYIGGATFRLDYREIDGGQWTKASNEAIVQLNTSGEFTVPGEESGITLTGLQDGHYRIVEVKAPDGYVISNETPVIFTVSGGVITSTDGTVNSVTYEPAAGTALDTFTIPNTPGHELPNTGGPGTQAFMLLGGMLVLLGVAVLAFSRRMRRNRA